MPPNGISMWVWPSMPPGMTYLPVASMTRVGRRGEVEPSACEPGASTAAIVSPSMRTSCGDEPVATDDRAVL